MTPRTDSLNSQQGRFSPKISDFFFQSLAEQASPPKRSNPVEKKSHFLLELWKRGIFAGQGKRAQLADQCGGHSWWNMSRWDVCRNTVINHRAPGYNQTAPPTNSFPPWVSIKSQGNVSRKCEDMVDDPQRPVSHRWFRPTSCCTLFHQASLPLGHASTATTRFECIWRKQWSKTKFFMES